MSATDNFPAFTLNNSGINRDKGDTLRLESGVRAYHVYAEAEELSYGIRFAYRNGGAKTNKDDDGIRLIRQVNEADQLCFDRISLGFSYYGTGKMYTIVL